MPFDITVGRTEDDKKLLEKAGLILLGKTYVKMGMNVSLSNPLYLDVARSHIILICGKKGSGKSYSQSVIAEGVMDLPDEIRKNLSIIFLDTMGVFWTMKYENKRDEELLEQWGLEPKKMDVDIYIPKGYYYELKEKGIPVDYPFAIQPRMLTAADWCNTFDIKMTSEEGSLISRVINKLKGNYGISDILYETEDDNMCEQKTKNIVNGLFQSAITWGLFDPEAVDLEKISSKGRISIIDLSCYTSVSGNWNIKALVVGLIGNKILVDRIISRKKEELDMIEKGFSYFYRSEIESEMPMVWLFIDECLPYDSLIETNKGRIKIGEVIERTDSGEKIMVRGYDQEKGIYDYYDINKTFRINPRSLIKLKTETSNILKCTPNHPVLTKEGFINASYAKTLAFPLETIYNLNKKLVLARVVGHILGDGYLSKSQMVGFCGKGGNELDLIQKDLDILNIKYSKKYERITKSEITNWKGEKNIVIGLSQEFKAGREAFRLFKSLGLPVGKKTDCGFLIPEFIIKGSKEEKAEFLAALMGADGFGLTNSKKTKLDFNVVRLSFNKIEDLEKEGWEYAKQITFLFKDLGIEVSSIKKINANIRKDGKKTIKFRITLKNNVNNIIKFIEIIGFRYNSKKELNSKKWLAYLRYYREKLQKYKELRKRALDLHQNEGIGKIKIGRILGIEDYRIREWIYYKRNARIGKELESFEDFIKKRCEGNVLHENIKELEILPPEPLYDIEVDKVHNFIANDIIVHNCQEFLPRDKKTAATDALSALLREGRQPGISLVLATQQPGKIHDDVITQADIVLCHRLTAKQDIDALNEMMQSYMEKGLTDEINTLPKEKGAAVVLDDTSERVYPIRVRPKLSWHGGEAPSAVKVIGKMKEF